MTRATEDLLLKRFSIEAEIALVNDLDGNFGARHCVRPLLNNPEISPAQEQSPQRGSMSDLFTVIWSNRWRFFSHRIVFSRKEDGTAQKQSSKGSFDVVLVERAPTCPESCRAHTSP